MIVTTKLDMDLIRMDDNREIYVMQDDRYTRNIEFRLLANGVPLALPAGYSALVRFRKPDGKQGAYDTLPDGSKSWSIVENRVTVCLAPEVCTAAGTVNLMVSLMNGQFELTTFAIQLHVKARPSGVPASHDYVNVTGFLPQTRDAKSGEYLRVTWVDEFGRVAGVETDTLEALPQVNTNQEGSFLRVVQGKWAAVQLDQGEGAEF